jgi:parvulin-like peptidyl-prolyl isomerase
MKKTMILFVALALAVLTVSCDTTTTEVKLDNTMLAPPETAQKAGFEKSVSDREDRATPAEPLAGEDLRKLDDATIAIIGQYVLTKEKYRVITDYMSQKFDYKLTKDQEKEFIQFIVNKKMMALEARSLGYADRPDLKVKYDWDFDDILSHVYYAENIEKKSQVSEKDAKAYYEAHTGDFVEIKAQHILVKSKQLADSLHKRILSGESFDEIAKKYSEDATTKEKGGNLGAFTKGVMVQEFEDTAFAMADGEVSQPVKTVYGYHIIKVLERKKYSYDDSKDKITKMIKEKKQQQVFDDAIGALKKKYKVTVNQDAVK